LETHRRGLQLAERYGYSVYDAMILAAALESGCKQLLTEDLQHQQRIESTLDILNPFAQ
jgi:predicted nucleic acid-binding protein